MYEILPHTADVRIRIENASLKGLFEDAGRALVAFIEVETSDDTQSTSRLTIESGDRTSLLVDFLNELLVCLHVDRLAFTGFDSVTIEDARLEATAAFATTVSWSEDVKTVTYHEADVVFDGESWKTTIVVDI